METFSEAITKGPLIMDGAMGTMLQARGLAFGTPPDLWNLENPQAVLAVHQEYIEAGAKIILTNTFGSSQNRLASHHAGEKLEALNKAGVQLARQAALEKVFVAGSIGPLGSREIRFSDIPSPEALSMFQQQAQILADNGCDCIILETMTNHEEISLALEAINDVVPLGYPLLLSMTTSPIGILPSGQDPLSIAHAYQDRLTAVGLNCAFGPEDMFPIFQRFRSSLNLPLLIKPNAGLPIRKNDNLIYPLKPSEFAQWGKQFRDAGADLIGGCCGTTPQFISALSAQIKSGN
jgi:5-methyltetrahydrofolate--homocysteine methyltransferase